jgi:8-oxo-dGTP pyrophosphatase MutT (NUDIX family)
VFALAHRALLKFYRRLPTSVRRFIVRVLAPSFTVGAICVIERDDGAMLLVHQVYRNNWGLPGGLTKRRESIEDCARREVREEVGLRIELLGQPRVVVDPVPRRIDVVFRARPAAGQDPDAATPSSPEIAGLRWVTAEDMPELQHETLAALAVWDLLDESDTDTDTTSDDDELRSVANG